MASCTFILHRLQRPFRGNLVPRKKLRWGHGATAVVLALLTVVMLVLTAPQIGLTWDEPVYIESSESYVAWFAELVANPTTALSAAGIQAYWALNHEHPPIDKLWSGLVWAGARYALDDLTAHRLGNMLLVGLLVALLYRLVAFEYGAASGLAASGALLTMPRFFFHAHLSALDVPAAATIFMVCYVFWRTRDQRD